MNLHTPIKDADPFLKKYASRLASLNIHTFEDFLYHVPFRYEDYSLIAPIATLQSGETVTIIGKIMLIKTDPTKQKFKTLQKATIEDTTGSIETIWFNQPYLTKMLKIGDTIAVAGKVNKNGNKLQLTSPEYELLTIDPQTKKQSTTLHTARLVPMYHETKGISSKWLRRQIHKILHESKENFQEHLPPAIIKSFDFMNPFQTIEQIHFPDAMKHAQKARQRLAFEELFFSQLHTMRRRKLWEQKIIGQSFVTKKFAKSIETFTNSLPFTLTAAQQKALEHIFCDVAKQQPMNRLLEGDVGSGKTVVATLAMYLAFLNGYQSVLMAPTEILAQQHFATIAKLLQPFNVKVDLVTSSTKSISKQSPTNYNLQMTHILVGTHAILSQKIQFDNLGLVVIDEQQRFGVQQRSLIRTKGKNPHFLTMTATPIPRTIALTMYGDLDLSVLDELPKGRKLIKTWFVPAIKRQSAYKWIEKQIKETDSQAFIICPFIEESESMTTIKAATKEFEYLTKDVFPNLKLGLLHGKMKSKEKNEVLQAFRDKKFAILIATPVVEVGIDIPNATIILIEAAERFGLSQLHQLRGRVGRGEKQSYCLLFTESKNPQTIHRLKALEKMHIGSQLAEFDLQLRGAGDMYGTAQHGQTFFKIASFADGELIEKANQAVAKIFPELEKYPKLIKKLEKMNNQEVSPD